jgi:putative ABC transport system permease protein
MQTLLRDLRYASRMLLAHPAVTAIAVLALALGTGANTTIFSVVWAVLLRPIPVHEPDRLVTIALVSEKLRVSGAQPDAAAMREWSAAGLSYQAMAAAA